MGNFFDFFSQPPPQFLHTPTSKHPTEPGLLEDFSYGWGKATTYDSYRNQVEILIDGAKQSASSNGEEHLTTQTFLRAAIVFAVSGMESYVQYLRENCSNTSTNSNMLPQKFDEYQRELTRLDSRFKGTKLTGENERAMHRFFQVRHAIVHSGSQITRNLNKQLGGNDYPRRPLLFGVKNTIAALAALDQFADTVETIFGRDIECIAGRRLSKTTWPSTR